ncbi:MAG: twin-arginine translocation signal domain-containing protein [Edaphobacter sp.]
MNISRRNFLKTAAAAGFPTIIPSRVLGQFAPSKQINIGAIGAGRISRGHDMPAILKVDTARITAVCDLSADRGRSGQTIRQRLLHQEERQSPTTAPSATPTTKTS